MKKINFLRRLRANDYDKIYSPHRSFRSAFIVWSLKVNDTYGHEAGDEVLVLPSKKKSKVKSIVTFEGDIAEAFAPIGGWAKAGARTSAR